MSDMQMVDQPETVLQMTEVRKSAAPATDSPKLQWQNLTFAVPQPQKKKEMQTIFENLSGVIKSGEFVALMGGSGAGKTSLINALTGRIAEGSLTGDVLFNGKKRDEKAFKQQIAFVEQQDILYERISVFETLMFVAKLKLSSETYTQADRIDRANQIINDLGLSHRRHNQITTLSGGERKRVAVGMQLITKPDMLFLDEPTSGIDAFNALAMIELLKSLCEKDGITILLTIHMPRENIVNLFDKVMVLSLGKMVWDGKMEDVLPHLDALSLPIPAHTNPADHLLDLCTIDRRNDVLLDASTKRATTLQEAWQRKAVKSTEKTPLIAANDGAPADINGEYKANYLLMVLLLAQRDFKELFRNKGYVIGTIMQNLLFLLIIGGIFFRLDYSQASVQSRTGVLFFICVNQTFPNLMPLILGFSENRKVIRRERAAGLYHSSASFIATFVSRSLLPMLVGLVYCSIIYFMINLKPIGVNWVIFAATIELTILNAIAQGLFLGALVPNVQLGLIIAPVGQIIFMLFGGLFANASLIPNFLAWIRWISPIRYAYTAVLQNEFIGTNFDCPPGQVCTITSGDQVLQSMSMDTPSVQACLLALFGWTCFYFPLGLVALYFTTKPKMKII